MHFAVGLVHAVDGNALSFMATRAAELIRRMGAVGEIDFPFRMGLKRMRLLFKTRTIDRQVAGLTPTHPRPGVIETSAVEFLERYLLDLGNLIESKRTELERNVVHHPRPFIALRREFAELVLDFLGAVTNR